MQTLKLTFSNPGQFQEFIEWYMFSAGSSWDYHSQVKITGGCNYEITGTADELYRLGYDWALYQFPPKK